MALGDKRLPRLDLETNEEGHGRQCLPRWDWETNVSEDSVAAQITHAMPSWETFVSQSWGAAMKRKKNSECPIRPTMAAGA